ncbi:carbamoyl phosphate synthase large subunit [Clostridioides difficile]|nr:carbamoyl phosphate synthase large subunit [Clostridioides difficile]
MIPGIMEHLERAGVHSGDSTTMYPSQNISDEIAPESFGIPKFELKFSDFGNFINLRFYCISPDIYVQSRGRAKHFMG